MTEDKKQKITKVNKTLKILLKSDLCVGSGFSYAGIIDSDVSFNKNGIPFISGRRLKGCMKEAAELIGIRNISEIFGIRGEDGVKGIFIGNAFPEDSRYIKDTLSDLQRRKDDYAKYLNQQNILEMYTSVKAQTKIGETGVAEENTLRFTRTINQYDKIKNTDMVFEAELSYEYSGEKDPIYNELKKIAKATRNIGMNRNRGLGSVKLEILDAKNDNSTEIMINNKSKQNGKKRISYCIRNIQPLLMSGNQDDVTENYISGASILGAFAGEYLKNGNADCKEFREMFLEGKVIFSNLTLAEKIGEEWVATYPAPLYINRLKKTKKLVNIAAMVPQADIMGMDQPKKLKTQFVLYHNGKYDIKEVKKEIIYHHTKKGQSRNGEEGLLYFLEAIEENQYFSGEIIVENDYLEKIMELLKRMKMRFGKSKSAQYGLCEIEPNSIVITDYEPVKAVGLKAGMRVLVTLASDGIFVKENGIYTIVHDEVRRLIGEQLGLPVTSKDTKSYIQTKVLTGFYTKWNLKKQQLPVIQAGSAFEYTLENDLLEYKGYIGERNLEGFGKCYIVPLTDAQFCLEEMENIGDKKSTKNEESNIFFMDGKETYLGKLFREILLEKLFVHMNEKAFENERIKISSSALGRLELMLTEVENETDSAMDRYVHLRKRIDAIRSKDTQAEIMKFLEKILGEDVFIEKEKENFRNMKKEIWEDTKKQEQQQKIIVSKIRERKDKAENMEEYTLLFRHFDRDLINAWVFQLWSGYLKNVLIYQKYLKKWEENV